MRLIAILLALLAGGCVEAHPSVDPRAFALRLETDRTICGATAVGPDTIETAAHCMAFPLATINGTPAKVVRSWATGVDRLRVVVSGIRFDTWATLGTPQQGDHVRWWGQPQGAPFVLREGVVVAIFPDGFLLDATICHGDSGSGLFSESGELVGVISFMTDDKGCTFVGAR